jgi:hypothetical protein
MEISPETPLNPLTGSNTWIEASGTGVCFKIWDGRAQLDTIEVDGPTGHIEGLTLRMYDPQSQQWTLYWANSKNGILDPPQIGQLMIANSPHFEQSFSDDGGKTWEVNWITGQTGQPTDPRDGRAGFFIRLTSRN